jgi:S1-C subfamily serine protease
MPSDFYWLFTNKVAELCYIFLPSQDTIETDCALNPRSCLSSLVSRSIQPLRGSAVKIRISSWFASLVCIFPVIFLALNASAADELRTGAIVEQVDQDSEGRRAGIREGDVLLAWARGNQSASIKSPFDLAIAEIEESPRGDVTIEGLRATTKLTWTLHPDRWGIRTRPIFSESFS